MNSMTTKNAFYLPSGRIFLVDLNGFLIECTEMRDISVKGKEHKEVRESENPKIIWNHLVGFKDKWLLTVSTQKGCPHLCKFCDVSTIGFHGNLTQDEIEGQVRLLLRASPYVTESKKVKIGFARMGEPSHNLDAVMGAICRLSAISESEGRNFRWLPCFNSILPRKVMGGLNGIDVIHEIMVLKEAYCDGFLHFQISCNTTDEDMRKKLFGGADVLSIEEIVSTINQYHVRNRTVTLNFIVINEAPIDVKKLMSYGLDKSRFVVKLIPLNKTIKGQLSGLTTVADYKNVEKLEAIANQFADYGIPVVYDSIARCEEAALCCGQLAQIYVKQ